METEKERSFAQGSVGLAWGYSVSSVEPCSPLSLKYEAVWVTGGFPGFLSVGRGSPCCPITGAHSSSIPAC